MNTWQYLKGALYKAQLDLMAKEYEHAHNDMRISFDLSINEIRYLLETIMAVEESPLNGEGEGEPKEVQNE